MLEVDLQCINNTFVEKHINIYATHNKVNYNCILMASTIKQTVT